MIDIVKLSEILPLPLFLIYSGAVDTTIAQNWMGPFLLSGLVALIATTWLVIRGVTLNRIFLGINLYLITGSLGFILDLQWLNNLYGELEASGMLAWVIIVGIGSMIISPNGFVGVDSPNKKSVRLFSILLLVVAVCAFFLSYEFRGNRLLSEFIPFIILFSAQNILKLSFSKCTAHKT